MTKTIMQATMLVNTDNVALARDTGNGATSIVLRDGSEYVFDMPFDDFARKVYASLPSGTA